MPEPGISADRIKRMHTRKLKTLVKLARRHARKGTINTTERLVAVYAEGIITKRRKDRP